MRRLMTVVGLVLGAALTACTSGSTGPELPTPWWAGTWRAVSVDGQLLPATITSGSSAIRYDSLKVYFGTGTIHSFEWSETLLRTPPVPLGCGGLVTFRRQADTLALVAPTALTTCPFASVAGRAFVRSGDALTHRWDGHLWVLTRVP